MHHGAENSPDSEKFDKGHIAPEPGMQTQGGADGDKQQDKVDVEYSMMQPVYSLEYTESIKPKHIPAEKVLHLYLSHHHHLLTVTSVPILLSVLSLLVLGELFSAASPPLQHNGGFKRIRQAAHSCH